ncbi:unnamed protein product [Phytophthora fragariaefolia]|uniref:Unnamed protein product n=1 Tax=Phytophthora fragariaefolia TaxID=1490495 RepID=A0A9W7CUQ7_9STRA|nr:unnamed protein product [Phytophthora fragariaefolia]
MRTDDFPRHPANLVKRASVLELVHSDVRGVMQTRSPGGCVFAVTFIDDYSRHVTVYFMKAKSEVLSNFKIFKAAMENATGKTIKLLRSDKGGEYTDKAFKTYLERSGIKFEKTVPYTPQQNGLAERMNRSLVQIVRTVKFMETTDPNQLMNRLEMDEDEEAGESEGQLEFLPPLVPASDVTSIVEARRQGMNNHAVTPDGAAITPYPDHPMITRSCDRHIDETTDPEDGGARKSKWWHHRRFGPSVKRLIKPVQMQLAIEGGMLMAVTEDVPMSYDEATTSNNRAQWKAAIKCELKSLMTNKT